MSCYVQEPVHFNNRDLLSPRWSSASVTLLGIVMEETKEIKEKYEGDNLW